MPHQGVAAALLTAPAGERDVLAARLRSRGPAGGVALLEACHAALKAGRSLPAHALELLFEIVPASASQRVGELRAQLDLPGRSALLRWVSRRDLPGFRDVEVARARVLVAFLDDEEALATDAAERCADWDLELVAQALLRRLRSGIAGDASRRLLLTVARSFVKLRSASSTVGEALELAQRERPWLVVPLLRGLGLRPDLVQAGALDPWVGVNHPSLRQAVDAVVDQVDLDLASRVDHLARLALFRRFRELDGRPEWAFREAHVALMDLASPERAEPALAALEAYRLPRAERIEALLFRATAEFLAERDPGDALRRADALSRADWPETAPLMRGERFGTAVWNDLELALRWRVQVPPPIGKDDLRLRRVRYSRQGGTEGLAWREAGRRRVTVALVSYVLHTLRKQQAAAERMLVEIADTIGRLESDWDFDRLGEPGDLEAALAARMGPLSLFQRALEGNEWTVAHQSLAQRKAHIEQAERGFRALIQGLARIFPNRVLGLPGTRRPPREPGQSERGYLDLTGSYAQFLQRMGEADKAAAILDHLIELLDGAAQWRNARARANYLFDRASIAMDRRNGKVALDRMRLYMRYFDLALRDVRQNPNRYVNPAAVRRFYASRLASGHISLAVLYNVVLGQRDKAREHCRQAYALDDTPFNRVLYACYLARDKKSGQAKALIATVDPTPPLYYNLACTYALSGDKEQALHYLALDLRLNHPAWKARNQQRDWAAKDRDLAALRGDPRFQELVRQRPEGAEK